MADNGFATAWRELRAAQNAAMKEGSTTRDPRAAIGGVSNVMCILGDNPSDFSFFEGGIGNTGSMTLQTVLADWGADVPEKNDSAALSGLAGGNTASYQVLSTIERNGILYILLGDNSAQ